MSNTLREYNKYIDSLCGKTGLYEFDKKEEAMNTLLLYTLNRTQSMFKWSGLPDSIPQRALELLLQVRGFAAFYHYKGNLYAFGGGLGGEPNPYYMPTIMTIANPALNLSVNAKIDVDCIVMPNDSMYLGLTPLIRRYATLMVENELSMKIALINSRIVSLISSDNDNTTKSAEKYLDDISKGKLGVIADKAFFNGVRSQPYAQSANTNSITNLIESMQYIKASLFNELGLNANYNMKRESINSGESQLNNDALLPLIDDMLACRKAHAEKVNEMFGTSISVNFTSAWEDNIQEIEAEQENLENGGNDEKGADNDVISET